MGSHLRARLGPNPALFPVRVPQNGALWGCEARGWGLQALCVLLSATPCNQAPPRLLLATRLPGVAAFFSGQ